MITPELVQSIKLLLAQGQKKEEIERSILASGWNKVDIDEAFLAVQNPNFSFETPKKFSLSKILISIVVVIVLSFLIRAGITYYFVSKVATMGQQYEDQSLEYYKNGEYDMAIISLENAVKASEKLGDKMLTASLYFKIALIYKKGGDSSNTVFYCNKAVALDPSIKEKKTYKYCN